MWYVYQYHRGSLHRKVDDISAVPNEWYVNRLLKIRTNNKNIGSESNHIILFQ